jgi:hypothetical protein
MYGVDMSIPQGLAPPTPLAAPLAKEPRPRSVVPVSSPTTATILIGTVSMRCRACSST